MARSLSREAMPFVVLAVVGGLAFALIFRATEPPPAAGSVPGLTVIEDPVQETANALEQTKIALLRATATTTPTMVPTRAPTTRSTINDCGTPTPGADCIAPPLPTVTPTPKASCYVPTPAVICQWPTEGP